MTITRIDFAGRFASRETLVVCVLVAGVPAILTPAGVVPTACSTSGTFDPLWWPGTAVSLSLPGGASRALVCDWLDPEAVWSVYREVDTLKGDAKVDALTFEVHDRAGVATAALSGPRARTAQLLAASLTAAGASVSLASTTGVPSSGLAWIGREALTYSAVGGGALTVATRGVCGSRARAHAFDETAPAPVTFGDWPRHWYGRMASVWIARLDGTTLTDPTLIYLGAVGPGVQRVRGTRWSLPIDHVTEVLQRKLPLRALTLTGLAHMGPQYSTNTPLFPGSPLDEGAGAPDRAGWHGDWPSLIRDANSGVLAGIGAAAITGGRVSLSLDVTAGARRQIGAAWHDPTTVVVSDDDGDGVVTWTSSQSAPDTCVVLDGDIPLPAPSDAAKIPGSLIFTVGGRDASAVYILTAKTARRRTPVDAHIRATGTRHGVMPFATVRAILPEAPDGDERNRLALVRETTSAALGIGARGDVVGALRCASLALDELDGGLHEDAIDWDTIAAVVDSSPLGLIPAQRVYYLRGGAGDTIISLLVQELRLRGAALATRNGRLAAVRTGVFASTEASATTITEGDLLTESGVPIEPEVIDAPTPVATSVRFALPGDVSIEWIDATHRAELGEGATMDCKALQHLPPGTSVVGVIEAIRASAQQVLGVLAEPSRVVRVTLGPRYLGLQEGDLVTLTHPRVPSLAGVVGMTDLTCQVEELRTEVMGGKGRVVAALRLQEPDLAGYAPEALVAAGGLSVSGGQTTIDLDTTSAFGTQCFAQSGAAPSDGFAVGQKVRLSQLARSPIADEAGAIVSLTSTQVVVDFAASGSMQTAATSAYGCILRFDDWATVDGASAGVRDDQERYLFVADDTAQDLGSGDTPKRWAP